MSLLGLGTGLIQTKPDNQERVIAFASKSLTDIESRYANIEREMLAVVFGTERFLTFLYGSKFVVESDHKPLAAIHIKNISQAQPHLQQDAFTWLSQLPVYSFDNLQAFTHLRSSNSNLLCDTRTKLLQVHVLSDVLLRLFGTYCRPTSSQLVLSNRFVRR